MNTSDFLQDFLTELQANHVILPPQIFKKIEQYYRLTQKWGDIINITKNLSQESFISENLLDPILAFESVKESFSKNGNLADFGTGGGFVGIIWHMLLWPKYHTTLIDSDRKKINFCKQEIRELKLENIQAIQNYIGKENTINPIQYDCITSRATWHFEELLNKVLPYSHNKTFLMSFLSQNQVENLNQKILHKSYTILPSQEILQKSHINNLTKEIVRYITYYQILEADNISPSS